MTMPSPVRSSRLTRVTRARARIVLDRSRDWGARAILVLLRRLPLRVQAIVKSELRPVGRLDYAPRRIDMTVNSPWQAYRLKSGAKEPETVAWLESNIRPGDTFYDIGANVGAYSLVAFAATGGEARILAFEPGFGTFAELCRNIQLNHAERSVVPLPIALGNRTTLGEFRYSETTPGAALHSWQASAPGEAHTPELVLPTISCRLDDLMRLLDLPQPTLIKLDVDGPEADVLEGAAKALAHPSLRSCIVELDVESHPYEDVVARLAAQGFRILSRHARGRAGPLHNVIFVRD
jgi:FkbM family methyltransferase